MRDTKDRFVEVLRDPQIDIELKKSLINRAPAFFGGEGNVDLQSSDISKGRKKIYKDQAELSRVSLEDQMPQGTQEPDYETETQIEETLPVSLGDGPTFDKETLLKEADDSLKKGQDILSDYTNQIPGFQKERQDLTEKAMKFKEDTYKDMMAKAEEKEKLRNKYLLDYEKAMMDWNSSKVIPMRALARTSTGVLIGASITQAVAAIVGDTKTIESIQQMMDSRIERDIRQQEYEIQRKGLKAKNILSLMKAVVPENPEVLRNQARQIMNEYMLLESEKIKQRAADAKTKYDIQKLQQSLLEKNTKLKLEIQKAAMDAANKRAELGFKYGVKKKTKIKSGAAGELKKRTGGEEQAISASKTALSQVVNLTKLIDKEDPILIWEKFKGKIGFSSKLRSLLDSLKNAAIRAQTGTQTEGDAVRIIEEMEGRTFDRIEDLRDVFLPKVAHSLIQTMIDMDTSGKLSKKDQKILKVLIKKFGSPEQDIMK